MIGQDYSRNEGGRSMAAGAASSDGPTTEFAVGYRSSEPTDPDPVIASVQRRIHIVRGQVGDLGSSINYLVEKLAADRKMLASANDELNALNTFIEQRKAGAA